MIDKKIQLTFNNTVNKRVKVRSNCELYSHDKNNNEFELTINNYTLTNEEIIILFKFVKSVKYWETHGRIEDNKIKFKFDTTLITDNERVNCYIILKNEEKESDIYSFSFDVKMSEYDLKDNLPVKERYFANSVVVDKLDVLTKEVLAEELEKAKNTFALKTDLSDFVRTSDISDVVRTAALNDYQLKSEMPNVVEIVNNTVDSKGFLTTHQSLVDYAKKSELPIDYVSNSKLEELKTQLTIDTSNFATKQSVEAVETKVTQLENRPVTSSYDDSEIKRKLKELEDRPVTANIDTSNFVTTTQLEDKHYLTEHQSLAGYVTETQLEGKNYLTEHQDISGLATKEQLKKAFLDDEEHEKYAKKTELPQPYNDTDIKSRLTVLENKPSGSGSELRGHGFPTGKDAPIGTTYIDEDVTNGALKWIKTKTGWKVIEGDTGWVNVPVKNVQPNTKMELRRVNNLVYVRFFNELAEGLAKFTNLYNADTTTRYLTIFKGLASFGWRPSTTQIQVIFPEINQGGNDYIYNTAQPPQPYLRLKTIGAGLNVDMQLDEFVITNNNLGVYINSFSYLTNDDWAPSLNII